MGASLRDQLGSILESRRFEWAITALIIVNAVILGLETSPTAMAAIGPLLEAADNVILSIFVVELAARIYVRRLAFFRDPWSLFDLFVVGIALLPTSGDLSVLRALRILRVLRLITVVPALKRVVAGLLAALPGMGSIVLLIGLLYYVFAVMATKMYGADFPNLFGTLGTTLFTLFTVMTLEGWVDGVVKPVMEKYPHSWVFFITYIIVCTFMVLNLFIGVVVNAMQSEHEKALAEDQAAERKLIEAETEPLVSEVKKLRADIADLKAMLGRGRT